MHWYDWHTVTERLQGRAYALTRGQPYKVLLDPNTPTGCCSFSDKTIVINPNLFSDVFQKMGLSGTSLDKANFLISRAVTGHETLHVNYSDPATVMQASVESPVLKMVLNLLEDARIEKIGSEQSHVSKTLFGFVNGIAARLLPEFTDASLADKFSGISLLLHWRLGADIPTLESNAAKLWNQVHRLADKALYAQTCADVLRLSREIVNIFGLDKPDEAEMPDDVREAAERTQSDVVGERSSEALHNPVKPESDDDAPIPSEEASEPENGGDGEDDPRSQDDHNDASVPTVSDDANNDGVDNSSQSSGATDDEEDTPPADCGQPDGTGTKKDCDNSAHSVRPTGDAEDIERLVEETAMQVSEDLDSIVPQETTDSPLIATAKSFRGRKYSDVVASPYAHYLPVAIPIAAELTRELRAEGPRGSSGANEYPGRFKARYYVRDRERPFCAQRFQGLTIPKMALTLVIDRSGSMEHIVHELRTMSMAVSMACEDLQIPLSIWALEGAVHVKRFGEHGPQVLAKIAGIQADTLTRVMPTMRDAVADLKSRPEELKQIVLIHDGMPSDRLDFISWQNELRCIGLFCMFIMPEEQYQAYRDTPEQLRESMDELVGPRNYAIAPVTGIAKHWCSFIRNKRNSHSRLIY